MIRRLVIATALLSAVLLASQAIAQLTTMGVGSNSGGGSGPTCTQGALKFNTNCNTVYAGH